MLKKLQSLELNIQNTIDTIVKTVNPEKVILFGSHAWGKPHMDSDVDLFVIKNTRTSTRTIARTIDRALWGRTIPLDIIVSTPTRVRERLKMRDFFITDVMQKGKVLYERT